MPQETHSEWIPFSTAEFDLTETIPHRLEVIAAHAPDRLAVKGKDATFTYGELCAYANGVARVLEDASSPGARVVVYLGHGARILAAIMGVLKGGRVYVPVDPAYPAARNGLILADADASVILTNNANLSGAREIAATTPGAGQTIINLDELAPSAAKDVGQLAVPEGPACLIYTSGSTGKPKGVVHTHQTVLHNAYRRGLVQKVTPDDRMTLLYSSSVMGAVHGTFTALMNGASLFPNNLREETVRGLIDWIRDERITVYHSVATVFRELASEIPSSDVFSTVRLVIFGGERVLRADLDNVWKCFPERCSVFAGFGSTETGTVRGWLLERNTVFEGDVVPSGYPVPEVDIRVFTETGEPAAPGEPGELAITSPFIFSGYWQNPEATKAALVQSADDPRRRTYRTGDYGVLLPDQRLVLTGRKDAQLTIRGFRVETGEIESAFLNHPYVKNAAVVVHGRDTAEPILSAFIVLEPGAKAALSELRNHAQRRLPAHMVPAHYAILDQLPMTPNGKTDRRTLESYRAYPVADSEVYVSPRDEVEATLVDLAERALGYGPIGIRTNLLEAGLTSLMAVRLLTDIERSFATRIPLTVLFEAPTVAALAGHLREEAPAARNTSLITINPSGGRPPLVGLPGISGVASFTYRTLAEHIGHDQPFFALQLQGLEGEGEAHRSVEEMAAHHIAVMRSVQPQGPYRLIGYSFGGRLAFEMAHQLRASGQDVAFLALLDTYAPGYPKRAPFHVRCGLHLRLLKRMSTAERVQYMRDRARNVIQRVRRLGKRFAPPKPEKREGTFDERIKQVLQLTQQASKRYKPPTYPGDIILFRATERPDWLGSSFEDIQNGWGAYTTGTIHVHKIPGVHLDMLKPPTVEILGRKLRECLERQG